MSHTFDCYILTCVMKFKHSTGTGNKSQQCLRTAVCTLLQWIWTLREDFLKKKMPRHFWKKPLLHFARNASGCWSAWQLGSLEWVWNAATVMDCNVVYNESDSVFAGCLTTTFINSTDATAENKLFQNLVRCLPRHNCVYKTVYVFVGN